MPFQVYKLQKFLTYPELAFKWAFFEPFIWSGNRHRHQPTAWYYIKHCIYIFGLFTLVGQIMALFCNLYMPHTTPEAEAYENSESKVFEATALICYFSCCLYKMWNIFWRRKDIGPLLEKFNELFPSVVIQKKLAEASDYKTEPKRGSGGYYRLAYFEEKSRARMRFMTKYFAFAYFYYNMIPILQLIYEILSPNQTVTYKTQSNAWFPWHNHNKHSTFVGFIFNYLVQASAEFAGINFIMCGEYLFGFFNTQMQLHFDYLAIALETLDATAPDAMKQLKTLISYHANLLRLFNEINSIFNFTFALDLINATFAISLMGLAMVMIEFGRAVMFSAGFSFFLILSYVFCKNGDELTDVSNKLSSASFYSNWYEGSLEYRRMIIFFIMRTNKPCEYQAYGYTAISMVTYMRMLKLSYQLFTSFRAIE
ncbi:putative odorant receptor 69a [Rhagoletis pomonella]|uniref:putative odorant receptor 69a n=1 Tax=Rhagoletis pomonella TaxID=28610 RepID=UPI0017813E6E|nr:putative odorant receptor 69a [Rhagoletis pomonella]